MPDGAAAQNIEGGKLALPVSARAGPQGAELFHEGAVFIERRRLDAAILALGKIGFSRIRDGCAARSLGRWWFRWCNRAIPCACGFPLRGKGAGIVPSETACPLAVESARERSRGVNDAGTALCASAAFLKFSGERAFRPGCFAVRTMAAIERKGHARSDARYTPLHAKILIFR